MIFYLAEKKMIPFGEIKVKIGTAIQVPQLNQVLGIIDNVTPSMLSANDFLV